MEKKSERLEVRLGYQEKKNFTEACDMQGDTPSGAIRRFINGYVKRSDQDVLSSAWRQSGRRRIVPVLIGLGVLTLAATAIYAATTYQSKPTADEIFSFRDKNGDGELDFSEHGMPLFPDGTPNGVIWVLDVDGSGTISRAEFTDKGKMVYTRFKDESRKHTEGMTLVEFEFWNEHTTSSIYSNATVNAEGLDRLVIWPAVGSAGIVVAEGQVAIQMELDEVLSVEAETVTVQTPN